MKRDKRNQLYKEKLNERMLTLTPDIPLVLSGILTSVSVNRIFDISGADLVVSYGETHPLRQTTWAA